VGGNFGLQVLGAGFENEPLGRLYGGELNRFRRGRSLPGTLCRFEQEFFALWAVGLGGFEGGFSLVVAHSEIGAAIRRPSLRSGRGIVAVDKATQTLSQATEFLAMVAL
jgi:hypothetical protein